MNASTGSLQLFSKDTAPSARQPVRGIAWVLRWAAAIAALVSSAAIFLEFGYCLSAEQALVRAARAAALEATLPRATYRSVEATVRRRFAQCEIPPSDLNLYIEQNGVPVRGRFQAREGDRFAISLAVPTGDVLPAWLRAITWRSSSSEIVVRAERTMPGAGLE